MDNLALKPHKIYKLEIRKGTDKGAVYQLVGDRATIGRSRRNDISLSQDALCSRHHVLIEISSQGVSVREISDKERMSLNGKKCRKGILTHKDKLVVGGTQFVFLEEDPQAPKRSHLSMFENSPEISHRSKSF